MNQRPGAAVEQHSPPSVYAIHAWVNGDPDGFGRVAWLTVERAFYIAPGLWIAGIRGPQLIKGALFASTGLTALLTIAYLGRSGRS